MDLDAVIARKPQVALVDELAHTNIPGSRHEKRYQDVLELLDHGIHVLTAVNIQHLETLNDAVARVTGVQVRETVPDTFLDRSNEIVNVDITVEELRDRLKQGKIYRPEKIEQALGNFFRKGNLSTLRELALRAVANEVGEKAATYRAREGLEPRGHSRARNGGNELVHRGGARHPHGRADCRPAGREVVRRLRRDARRARRPHLTGDEPRGAPAQHLARPVAWRDARPCPARPAGRRPDSVRPHGRHHPRDLRPDPAVAARAAAPGHRDDRFLREVPEAAVQVVAIEAR